MTAEQNDPRAYLRLFWRWKLLFLACVVCVPAIAYAIVSREQKVYQSSVLLQENAVPVDASLLQTSTLIAPTAADTNPNAVLGEARVIETPDVAKLAAENLSPRPANADSLLGDITATGDTNTGFVTVTATATQPTRAADIANAFGTAVVSLTNGQVFAEFTTAINRLRLEVARGAGGSRVGNQQLSAQLQQLRAMRAAQTNNAQVLQAAVPDSSPVSPRIDKVVILGLIGGLLLGVGAVFVAKAVDRRVRHPEDLEEMTGLPLLTTVPSGAFSADALANSHDSDAFQMLRSALTFFNVDRPLSTVAIASPVKGDGKTTVATRLAVATAQGGRDVVLVDADLRRPQAASRLHVEGEPVQPGHGLAGVLTGQSTLLEALVHVPIGDHAQDEAGTREMRGALHLLPAGGNPPNPSELLASQRMREVLAELGEIADLVVVDTTPLLAVSDALPLLDSVSGLVLIARLNWTTKDAVNRLTKMIANTNAAVLGVVATGVRHRRSYGGYGYYANGYGSNGNLNGHRGFRRRRLAAGLRRPR